MTTLSIICCAALAAALILALFMLRSAAGRNSRLSDENASLKTQLAVTRQQLADEQATAADRFKALANSILQESNATLENRARLGLEAVLAPVRTSIESFTRDFKACYDTERADRVSLRSGIESLAELNRRVSLETNRLSNALKGDRSFQGQWGEMILANVLELSGLEQGRWLTFQHSSTTDDGRRLRPDAIIRCPGNRYIVIDAKCSLSAFLRWQQAGTDAERLAAAKAHVQAIDRHIATLDTKAYQDFVGADGNTADFTIMFLPNEGAFVAAMQADDRLWERAFKARVIIASPVHLVTVVKLIEQMWVVDDRGNNARDIAEEAVRMLNKLASALEDISKVGSKIDDAHKAWEDAVSKLSTGRGSVVRHVERLRAMGVKAARRMPAAFETARDDGDDDSGDNQR